MADDDFVEIELGRGSGRFIRVRRRRGDGRIARIVAWWKQRRQ